MKQRQEKKKKKFKPKRIQMHSIYEEKKKRKKPIQTTLKSKETQYIRTMNTKTRLTHLK